MNRENALSAILRNEHASNEVKEYASKLYMKQVPEHGPSFADSVEAFCSFRPQIVKLSGFSLITKNWVRELAKLFEQKTVLEVMSGTGMLAKALQDEGIRVIATDNNSWNMSEDCWTNVEPIDAVEAVNKYGDKADYILVSWIPYDNNIGTDILNAARKHNKKLVVIGEDEYGCCANQEFFDTAEYEYNGIIENANRFIKRWNGIHDYIALYA